MTVVLCTLFVKTQPTYAAASNPVTKTQAIYVTTKCDTLIAASHTTTFKQSVINLIKSCYNIFNKTPTIISNVNGEWWITAATLDGSHTIKQIIKGDSIILSLNPNKTYKLTLEFVTLIPQWFNSETGNSLNNLFDESNVYIKSVDFISSIHQMLSQSSDNTKIHIRISFTNI